jgi:hypothetical protein
MYVNSLPISNHGCQQISINYVNTVTLPRNCYCTESCFSITFNSYDTISLENLTLRRPGSQKCIKLLGIQSHCKFEALFQTEASTIKYTLQPREVSHTC